MAIGGYHLENEWVDGYATGRAEGIEEIAQDLASAWEIIKKNAYLNKEGAYVIELTKLEKILEEAF